MGNPTFIFREEDATALQNAFSSMALNLREEISDMRAVVSGKLSNWSLTSQSRQAQMILDIQLGQRADELADALDKASKTLGEVCELARDAEIRNVAVLD